MSTCAITGAAGFLGGVIARRFRHEGWSVLSLGRRPPAFPAQHVDYRLGEDPAKLPLTGVDTLIHCAWDLKATTWNEIAATNVQGSITLLKAAQVAGVRRIIFISSMSAYTGCRSMYGRAKCLVEAEALKLGLVIRPGLVWAEQTGGIVGAMERVIARSPVVPLIGSGNYLQYPVHCDDVAEFVWQAAQLASLPVAPLSAAASEPLTFRGILQALATRAHRKPLFLPLPWRLLHTGLRLGELLRFPLPFRSDSLLGLVYSNPKPDFTPPPGLIVKFRPFA